METIIDHMKRKLGKYYASEVLTNDVIGILSYIYDGKGTVEQYIFDNKLKIWDIFFRELISPKQEGSGMEYPYVVFFHLTIKKIEEITCYLTSKKMYLNANDQRFVKEYLPLVSEYYYSLENMYQEFIFEYERKQRKRLDYPLEAYEYKRSDGLPI